MENLIVSPCEKMFGEVEVPGDKSISHRSIFLGALTEGNIQIENFLTGADCIRTLKVFNKLGIDYELQEKNVLLRGRGLDGFTEPGQILDAGNSGTLMRLALGLLSAQSFFSVLDGDFTLKKRPMDRVVYPLRKMGAKIWGRENGKYAPLAIKGNLLQGITYHLPVASAQVKSALMLAGLYASGETRVIEPGVSRDHTERMLTYLGASVKKNEGMVVVSSSSRKLDAKPILIPGDFSSAAFLIAAGLLVPKADIIIKNVGVNPTRTGLLRLLKKMGARLEILNYREKNNEPIGDIRVRTSRLKGIKLNNEEMGTLIDEIPVLAVLASKAEGTTEIRGASELRVKESDRIRSMVLNLKAMGVEVKEISDGMIIEGSQKFKGGKLKSYSDHRVAMALAVAGLVAEEELIIEDTSWIDVSFPGFVELFNSVISEPIKKIELS